MPTESVRLRMHPRRKNSRNKGRSNQKVISIINDPKKGPPVVLDFEIMFCQGHIKPFVENWPGYSTLALLGMFNAAVADERLVDECNKDIKELESVMGCHRPVCCYLNTGANPHIAEDVIALAQMGEVWGMPSSQPK